MSSLLNQAFEFIRNHHIIINNKQPSHIELDVCSYALYDNDKHEILNIVNLSEEQADELNKGFKHEGEYKMRYVLLKISDTKGDDI